LILPAAEVSWFDSMRGGHACQGDRCRVRAQCLRARTLVAYFLIAISAGRYREISKPAGTWHIVGLIQCFIKSSFHWSADRAAAAFGMLRDRHLVD